MAAPADRVFAAAFCGIALPVLASDVRVTQFIGLAETCLPLVDRANVLIQPMLVHFETVEDLDRWASDDQRAKRTRWLMDARDIATDYLLRAAADGVRLVKGEA